MRGRSPFFGMSLSWSLHRSRPDGADDSAPGPVWPGVPPVAGLVDGAVAPVAPVDDQPGAAPARGLAGQGPFAYGAAPSGAQADDLVNNGPGLPADEPGGGQRQRRSVPFLVWWRQSTFRSRISFLVALAVGISVTLAAVVTYVAAREELGNQVNSNLSAALNLLPPAEAFPFSGTLNPQAFVRFQERTGDQIQVIGVNPSGNEVVDSVQSSSGSMVASTFFTVTPQVKQLFSSGSQNVEILQTLRGSDGRLYRVAAVNVEDHLTVLIGYPLANTDHTLAFLRLMLLGVVLGGIGLAMALGWGVGKATMKPVEGLTLAAEHVAETQDLTATIDESGNDELARLAHSFNSMLEALGASRLQQAHLVSDAGHELRTPLTSLRTNIEVLMRNRNLADDDRDALLGDVEAQLQELTNLVGDLVDLAREDEQSGTQPEPVALDQLVERAVERAKRRAMSVTFDVRLQPGQLQGQPALLERAVMNVLDNAAKWSPAGGTVTVTLSADQTWHLRVTDQGPGIAAEDLPHIFERFYRAASARSLPGSGLGLAIVQRVISSHGGTINVSSTPGNGTTVDITLPLSASDN